MSKVVISDLACILENFKRIVLNASSLHLNRTLPCPEDVSKENSKA